MTDDIETLIRWLEIREKFEKDFKLTDADQLKNDIHHSALLERMLDGIEPLPLPPPKSFGCPWYELIENDSCYSFDVSEMDHPMELGEKALLIDQDVWEIVEKISNGYIIKHHTRPDERWTISYEGEKDPPNWYGKDEGKPAPQKISRWVIYRQKPAIEPARVTLSTGTTTIFGGTTSATSITTNWPGTNWYWSWSGTT